MPSWTKELKGGLESIGLASVWQNQQVCNFTEISKLKKKDVIIWKGRTWWKECRKSA
jgi:hypothetical protein